MKREELAELHYISPMANVPSIRKHGILSHNRAKRIEHESVAMGEIQDRRAKVVVPGGRPLHDYANLYFDARNPMMYKRHADHTSLCVLRVSTDILDLRGVVVTDGNASSGYARFASAPSGISIVDLDLTFAEYWTDPDAIQAFRRRSAKCAEVLVPDRVDQSYVLGAYVSCPEGQSMVAGSVSGKALDVAVNSHLFFK
ncbi:MAG: DUF4433 domain-containing protein [Chloroflexi bacterium]|nr:DUF4433 domain-containing protein [Chloroflexota bacterium]